MLLNYLKYTILKGEDSMYGYNWGYPNVGCNNDNGSWLWIILIIFIVLFLFRGNDCNHHCN